MPTTHTQTTSRQARKGTTKRGRRQDQGRQGYKGDHEKATRIIADSIYSLSLAPRPGTDVMLRVDGRLDDEFHENGAQMYDDLLACYQHAMKVLGKPCSSLNLRKAGIELHMALASLIERFEADVLPKGFDYNIDFDDVSYFFTAFQEINTDWYWHTIVLHPVMSKLKNSPRKLQAFLEFVKCVAVTLGMTGYWELLDWPLDYIGDEYDSDGEDEDNVGSHWACVDEYLEGDARIAFQMLKAAKMYTPKNLIKRHRYSGAALDLLNLLIEYPYHLGNFRYLEFIEDQSGEGAIRINSQYSVLWKSIDPAVGFYCQMLDDQASNCGVVPMSCSIRIDTKAKAKYFDPACLKHMCKFPEKLSEAFQNLDRNPVKCFL